MGKLISGITNTATALIGTDYVELDRAGVSYKSPISLILAGTTNAAALGGVASASLLAPSTMLSGTINLGVTYTNSLAYPIYIYITLSIPETTILHMVQLVIGSARQDIGAIGSSNYLDIPITFIVPAGQTYSITVESGSPTRGRSYIIY
jgi:hypothetical protein